MWVYKQLKNIKTALFFIAMAMIISLFFYNQSISLNEEDKEIYLKEEDESHKSNRNKEEKKTENI